MKSGFIFYVRLMLVLVGLGALPAYAMGQAPANEPPLASTPELFSFFKDCETCPQLVALPAGEFIMGSDERHKAENPAHSVTINKAFAIGRYE
ncbi:MAG: SUMF1/EgtB/PvdO family nonheme iron enzyme, partial [Rhodospirillaceae bacterium]|nr:SUMF1/EgtB/PvdO family nonheme iron enzyme [Rhodospirillaceae bacterium]